MVRNRDNLFKRRMLPIDCPRAGVVTGVLKTIEKFVMEMVKDRENRESIWQYKKCIYSY